VITGDTYEKRVRSQMMLWANGLSKHNHVDGECCPDFSCCMPDFADPLDKRREQFKQKYGKDANGKD